MKSRNRIIENYRKKKLILFSVFDAENFMKIG